MTLRFHSEISKCVMENLCVLLMKIHNVGDLFPPAFFGKNALYVTSMKTRDVGYLFPPASFGGDALCVACIKTCNVEDLFQSMAEIEKSLVQQVIRRLHDVSIGTQVQGQEW